MNMQRSNLGVPAGGGVRGRRAMPQRKGSSVGIGNVDHIGGLSAEETDAVESATSDFITQAMPVAQALLEASAAQDPDVVRAKIENYKALRDRKRRGSVAWTLYNNRIRVLQGKLTTSRRVARHKEEDRESKHTWALLGKGTLVTGIGVGVALILLLNRMGRDPRRDR